MLDIALFLLILFVFLAGILFILANAPFAAYSLIFAILVICAFKAYKPAKINWLLKKRWFDKFYDFN